MNRIRGKLVLILVILLVTSCNSETTLPRTRFTKHHRQSRQCHAAVRAGVDMSNFMGAVTHLLHSITLEDIRFFFDDRVPEDNDIPSVNLDLKSTEPVLTYAPSFPSKFSFPLGAHIDKVLQRDDDPTSFFVRGTTILEDIAHGAHMVENWFRASKAYKSIVERKVDAEEVCPCLLGVEQDDIFLLLEAAAENLRNYTTMPGEARVRRAAVGIAYPNTPWPRGKRSIDDNDDGPLEAQDEDIFINKMNHHEGETIVLPELKDAESWKYWRNNILEMDNPMDEQGIYNFAMYMLCKINRLLGRDN